MNDTIRIILADDHQLVRDGLTLLLTANPKWKIVGEAENGSALLQVLSTTVCDIVITDLNMPGMRGIDLITAIKSRYPNIPVLVLTMHDEQEIIQEILLAEADGYLLKNSGRDEVIAAVSDLLNGKTHYSAAVYQYILSDYKKLKTQEENIKPLSPREIEILQLIVSEYTSKEIADTLNISKQTVDTHRLHIMEKTGSKTLVGLIKFAMRNGIIT